MPFVPYFLRARDPARRPLRPDPAQGSRNSWQPALEKMREGMAARLSRRRAYGRLPLLPVEVSCRRHRGVSVSREADANKGGRGVSVRTIGVSHVEKRLATALSAQPLIPRQKLWTFSFGNRYIVLSTRFSLCQILERCQARRDPILNGLDDDSRQLGVFASLREALSPIYSPLRASGPQRSINPFRAFAVIPYILFSHQKRTSRSNFRQDAQD